MNRSLELASVYDCVGLAQLWPLSSRTVECVDRFKGNFGRIAATLGRVRNRLWSKADILPINRTFNSEVFAPTITKLPQAQHGRESQAQQRYLQEHLAKSARYVHAANH
jgi:hypothetical protein